MNRKVFIVIVTYNGLDDTLECLNSLRNVNYSNYSIVLVDNGSTNESLEQFRRLVSSNVYLLENNENLGFAKGNNVGIEFALSMGADFIMLLNPDTVVTENVLSVLVEFMQNNKMFKIVRPLSFGYIDRSLRGYNGGYINLRNWTITPINSRFKDIALEDSILEVDFVAGDCLMISSDIIKRVGMLDERFFFGGGEDLDICTRVKKAGYKVAIIGSIRILHKGEDRSTMLKRTLRRQLYGYYMIRNRILLISKHCTKSARVLATLFLLRDLFVWGYRYLRYYRSSDMLISCVRGVFDLLKKGYEY
ncbi:MAG: glycosyltransferase family 2 protein [Candidatus Methanomethyliaceae archaeon]